MPSTISQPSVQSLLLQMQFQGQPLSTGTGFIVDTVKGKALITNRHNVTGRRQDNGKPLATTGGIPDEVVIVHNVQGKLGQWIEKTEKLLNKNGDPLWFEHPIYGGSVDFVGLLLTDTNGIDCFPYDMANTGPDIMVGPADSISIVGFPFGIQAGGSLAVWATGFMASEPDIDFNGLPQFLVDCRGRPGQSGSAVIAYRSGGTVSMKDGSARIVSGPVTKFLGIYSGRINDQSDLGFVWKATAINELVVSIT